MIGFETGLGKTKMQNISRSGITYDQRGKGKKLSKNFTHSSRKAWNLVQKIDVNPKTPIKKSYLVTANDIAAKLLNNSKADVSKSRQRKVERELKNAKKIVDTKLELQQKIHPERLKSWSR